MDRHPLTTPNSALTDALNATYVTSNGNEGMLQNDMGNTLIQDSTTGNIMQLREGFIPVGMKEHGGILYIASVNKDGEGELGTIPSPIITWDFKTNNNDTEIPLVVVDGSDKKEKKNYTISNKIYPGELYTVVLNLGDSQWDEKLYYTCQEPVYTFYERSYSKIKPNPEKLLLITTAKNKGYYKINLISNNDYNNYLLSPNPKQKYYINSSEIEESEKAYQSNYWFIPKIQLGDKTINEKYMRSMEAYNVYPATIPGGKLTLSVERETIDEFQLVPRAGGIALTQGESYLPYTYGTKDAFGDPIYYTYFSSFRYHSDSSVRINKLVVSIIKDSTQEDVPIYYYDNDNNKDVKIEGGIIYRDISFNGDLINGVGREDGEKIIPQTSPIFRTVKYSKSPITWYYITKKVLHPDEVIFNNGDLGNNTHYSYQDIVELEDTHKGTGREGLFYIISNENDVWYTATIKYYDQTDQYLGDYQIRFNPNYNDFIGIGQNETKSVAKETYMYNTEYTVEDDTKNIITYKTEHSENYTEDSNKENGYKVNSEIPFVTETKIEKKELENLNLDYNYLFVNQPNPANLTIKLHLSDSNLVYPYIICGLQHDENGTEIYTCQQLTQNLKSNTEVITELGPEKNIISTGRYYVSKAGINKREIYSFIPQDIYPNENSKPAYNSYSFESETGTLYHCRKLLPEKTFYDFQIWDGNYANFKNETSFELGQLTENIIINDNYGHFAIEGKKDVGLRNDPSYTSKYFYNDIKSAKELTPVYGIFPRAISPLVTGKMVKPGANLDIQNDNLYNIFRYDMLLGTDRKSHNFNITIQDNFTLTSDKTLYVSKFSGMGGTYKRVTQFDHYYIERDSNGDEKEYLGNLNDSNPVKFNLELNAESVKNYMPINDLNSTDGISLENYIRPKHSAILNYYNLKDLKSESLKKGIYVINMYAYILYKKNISRTDFILPKKTSISTNRDFPVIPETTTTLGASPDNVTIKVVKNGENKFEFNLKSGVPQVFQIDENDYRVVIENGSKTYVTSFGIYKVEFDSNVKDIRKVENNIMSLVDYNSGNKNPIVLQLVETYIEKAKCLGNEYIYNYSPDYAYQINKKLNDNTAQTFIADPKDDSIDTKGRSIKS